ncbi:hypothetical protein [Microbacterium esteraromaticum]|uniref:hypothetical protein n=1 Tax=Microbacterium esteraromaticum TaxID=57043 RepID=UPI0019D40CF5|nr:hypothetical protein [Microbacterium esteraromaticum]MBN7793219.1 hypothetical protein [Microbacterium esteraromaticum]
MASSDTRTAALDALRDLVGRPDATFHDGQYEAIEALRPSPWPVSWRGFHNLY